MHNNPSPMLPGFFYIFLIVWLVVSLLLIAFAAYMLWRIFKKTGNHGALSLLVLIPGVGTYVVLAILAFSKWPIETKTEPQSMGYGMGVMLPPSAPQGYQPQGPMQYPPTQYPPTQYPPTQYP